jgi:hypothetical protein
VPSAHLCARALVRSVCLLALALEVRVPSVTYWAADSEFGSAGCVDYSSSTNVPAVLDSLSQGNSIRTRIVAKIEASC